MIGGAIKKKLSNMSGSGSTIMMILGFVLLMLIKMYLVKMSYNIIAPKIMKDDKWETVDKKSELLDLIDNKCFLLREKYYNILKKNKYNISENQKKQIDQFLDQYHEDDKQTLIDIINMAF